MSTFNLFELSTCKIFFSFFNSKILIRKTIKKILIRATIEKKQKKRWFKRNCTKQNYRTL